jgi:predicted metal-dependent peptidase
MKAKDKITKAWSSLVLTAPFFASLALTMRLIEDPECDTMWTDGISMGYNPEFIESLPLEEVKGLICHEVMHVACNHNTRRGRRDHEKWNIACDYAIDPIVKNAGFEQPWENSDPRYHNWEAEKIFKDLFQGCKERDSHGEEKDAGQEPEYPCGFGEVKDLPGKDGCRASEAEKRQAEQEQKIAVRQAAQTAHSQGNLPDSLRRFIDAMTLPKVPWREVLARFLTENARNDYSWKRPNRRFVLQGLYLPELKNPELGPVALLLDTSGSISQKDLDDFASEIQGILAVYQTELIVIYVDAAVQGHAMLSSDEPEIHLELKGGGGTDYRPGFQWLQEQGHMPTAAVYLTDGYCRSFPEEPDFPTLWVLTQKTDQFTPPFGEVIVIRQHE